MYAFTIFVSDSNKSYLASRSKSEQEANKNNSF